MSGKNVRNQHDNDNCWNVYMHVNKMNGMKYVGITSQRPKERWRGGSGYRRNLYFKHAIDK